MISRSTTDGRATAPRDGWLLPPVDLATWAIERSMHPHFPSVDTDAVGWISTDQMREIDRVMIDELGITLVQMMEQAGSGLARLVHALASPSTVAVYAGVGGNGGGGLAAARHLHNHGVDVTVVLPVPRARMTDVTRGQLDIVERLGVPVVADPVDADVAIDALIGYSLRHPLDTAVARAAGALRAHSGTVVSLDVPTGLDATTGRSTGDAVVPDATLTLCLPKTGLADPVAVGALFVADIGVPPEVVRRVGGGDPPPFAQSAIVHLRHGPRD